MAKYIGARCKLCRREGAKLFLKGDRCLGAKCAVEKRRPSPRGGGFITKRRNKRSDYAIQLREKQKIRRYYCVLEKQFRLTFDRAVMKKGVTGEIMLQYLELRLDSILFNLGFASSRYMAKQLINHGHILVNGRKVNVASFTCREGDVITVKEKSRRLRPINESLSKVTEGTTPDWLELDIDKMTAKVIRLPQRDDIKMDFNEQLVVELYSK
jgi:small subunit ribosomal protein S4